MAMITNRTLLNVGTELTLDLVNLKFYLVAAGNLIAKDGVDGKALYSKFVDLWDDALYNKEDFPAYVIGSPRAGMFAFGFDGSKYNNWAPGDDFTRSCIRNIGWTEYNSVGAVLREYVGAVVGASGVPGSEQFYYQAVAGGAPIDFTFTDAPNEAIRIDGAAKTHFKVFAQPYGFTYDSTVLADVFETATGPYKIGFAVTCLPDLKITNLLGSVKATADAAMAGAPYTGISIAYYAAGQTRSIGGVNHTFSRIITGNNATAEQIYAKMQYLRRQATDVNSAGAGTAGPVTGKTAPEICWFVGDVLHVNGFIDGYNSNDINRIVFVDDLGVDRTFPFTAAGTLTFDASFVGGIYRAYFESGAAAGNNFTEDSALTVENASALPIAGTITAASIAFDYAYDSNVQRGAGTDGTPVNLIIYAVKKGSTKPRFVRYTLTRATGQAISFAAEADLGYVV